VAWFDCLSVNPGLCDILIMVKCEIKSDGLWVPIGIPEAYTLAKGVVKRCIGCHGAVHLYPAEKGSGASKPHFGHNKANPKCPHSRHPNPVE
jgi:hypothetical protein